MKFYFGDGGGLFPEIVVLLTFPLTVLEFFLVV
jgi:hypothetical protein